MSGTVIPLVKYGNSTIHTILSNVQFIAYMDTIWTTLIYTVCPLAIQANVLLAFFIAPTVLSALRLLGFSYSNYLIFSPSSKLKDILWWLFCPHLSAITFIFHKMPGKAVIYDTFYLRLNWIFSQVSQYI